MATREFEPFREGFRREALFLVTEDCNLDCVYCYEKHKNSKALPAGFIIEKVREEMATDRPCRLTSVGFFGGEPLLAFDVIREVVEHFRDATPPAGDIVFQVTTNGTLLDEGMKKWLAANRERVIMGLSMDGTKEAHDLNRSNSYDAVIRHIDFFRENWPKQPVKMTVTPRTIDMAYDGVVHIHDLGLPVEPDVVFEDVWGGEESEKRFVRSWAGQLDRLVEYYSIHPEVHRPKVVTRDLHRLFEVGDGRKLTFCGAGRYTNTYMADGTKFPCFRFSPLCVDKPLYDVFAAPDTENEKCAACAFEGICSSCEGLNYAVTGRCFNRTTYHCRFFMVSLLASARLLLLDHPSDLARTAEGLSKEERLLLMQKLLAVRLVNDLCGPVAEWAGLQ